MWEKMHQADFFLSVLWVPVSIILAMLHTLVSPYSLGAGPVGPWNLLCEFLVSWMSSQFYIPCSNSHSMTYLSTWCTMHSVLGNDCHTVGTGAVVSGIGTDTFTHLTLFQSSVGVSWCNDFSGWCTACPILILTDYVSLFHVRILHTVRPHSLYSFTSV